MQPENATELGKGLIFLHIPKTAGMTMHQVVSRQYPSDTIYWVDGHRNREDIERFMRLPPEQRQHIQCMIGHVGFGLHRYFQQPVDYLTLLRDPVERVISHYFYVKRSPDNYLHDWVVSRNITLKQYVSSKRVAELNNGQTRLLCGMPQMDTIFGHDPLTDAAFEAACRNLESMSCIGLVERFDESLLMFRKILGWGQIFYARANVTRSRAGRDALPEDVLDAIKAHNQYDLELYALGRRLVEERLQMYEITPDELRSFHQQNAVYGQLRSIKNTVTGGMRTLLENVRRPQPRATDLS